MKPITQTEVMGLADYETVRDRFRARVIEEKKLRRVKLGDRASCVFENRDTVLLQIQEMLRTERITRAAAVKHEVDTYNELIPGERELSCTLMIEIDDKEAREKFLVDARGMEKAVALVIGGERYFASMAKDRLLDDRASAVQYLKVALTEAAAERVHLAAKRDSTDKISLIVDHPAYRVEVELSRSLTESLAEDLDPENA